jgi:hypothetical protein
MTNIETRPNANTCFNDGRYSERTPLHGPLSATFESERSEGQDSEPVRKLEVCLDSIEGYVENNTSESNGCLERILLRQTSSFLDHENKLSAAASTGVLVNFISVGYILNPYGKRNISAIFNSRKRRRSRRQLTQSKSMFVSQPFLGSIHCFLQYVLQSFPFNHSSPGNLFWKLALAQRL